MGPEADDLEWELQRNLKLRQELGAEARLELLVERGAAAAEGARGIQRAARAVG